MCSEAFCGMAILEETSNRPPDVALRREAKAFVEVRRCETDAAGCTVA
jgi:hypothetical protein